MLGRVGDVEQIDGGVGPAEDLPALSVCVAWLQPLVNAASTTRAPETRSAPLMVECMAAS